MVDEEGDCKLHEDGEELAEAKMSKDNTETCDECEESRENFNLGPSLEVLKKFANPSKC